MLQNIHGTPINCISWHIINVCTWPHLICVELRKTLDSHLRHCEPDEIGRMGISHTPHARTHAHTYARTHTHTHTHNGHQQDYITVVHGHSTLVPYVMLHLVCPPPWCSTGRTGSAGSRPWSPHLAVTCHLHTKQCTLSTHNYTLHT